MCITWQITNFLTIIWISDNQNKLIQVIIHNNNHNHNCYYLYYLYFFQLQYITMNTYIYWATNVSLMEMVFDHFSLNTTLKNGRQTLRHFLGFIVNSSRAVIWSSGTSVNDYYMSSTCVHTERHTNMCTSHPYPHSPAIAFCHPL